MKKIILLLLLFFFLYPSHVLAAHLWPIQSIDTMKTSRDMARTQLYNPSYDTEIQKELRAIKSIGANYVAIDTPYDSEFLPYLTRWVMLARKTNLHVWFRGNFSSWEGWFDYPKDMKPQQHIASVSRFIKTHANLFMDGDIFDPCPECENAGYWPQPSENAVYNTFIRQETMSVEKAFTSIHKKVTVYPSIIGGRAKEVLTQDSLIQLGHVVPIDHYFSSPQSMTDYIDYFSRVHAATLVSEFGAPVPDINGSMTNTEQAAFIQKVLDILYTKKAAVVGLNYYVIRGGTTALLNTDGSPKKAVSILHDYFQPAAIQGVVKNELGDALSGVHITTLDGAIRSTTNTNGYFSFVIPCNKSATLSVKRTNYFVIQKNINTNNCHNSTLSFTMRIVRPTLLQQIRLFLKML